MSNQVELDVEKSYSQQDTIAALRRLADALEQNTTFEIFLEGVRVFVPPNATIQFEYEREEDEQELEIEVKWKYS
ncbi:amphi-Trp domain-containing protein [Fortiea contorta]|uniref:amphi-Trp domain-containing protein n=1 Tax=Fortiea contorta TaxID=1892405 RepID=UPI00034C8C49|nr:amphi-Trp domain-containing protein [Fortiea contorta]